MSKEHLVYIENAVPTPAQFDEDWEPIGPSVRADLEAAGEIVDCYGRLFLTPKGRIAHAS